MGEKALGNCAGEVRPGTAVELWTKGVMDSLRPAPPSSRNSSPKVALMAESDVGEGAKEETKLNSGTGSAVLFVGGTKKLGWCADAVGSLAATDWNVVTDATEDPAGPAPAFCLAGLVGGDAVSLDMVRVRMRAAGTGCD